MSRRYNLFNNTDVDRAWTFIILADLILDGIIDLQFIEVGIENIGMEKKQGLSPFDRFNEAIAGFETIDFATH